MSVEYIMQGVELIETTVVEKRITNPEGDWIYGLAIVAGVVITALIFVLLSLISDDGYFPLMAGIFVAVLICVPSSTTIHEKKYPTSVCQETRYTV